MQTARIAQLAHEEAHGRGAVQLHMRALWEAFREAGQRQVPHAQKPPGPQARLTHPTIDRPYLFVCSLGRYSWACWAHDTAAGAAQTAGRKDAPLPRPRAGPLTPPRLVSGAGAWGCTTGTVSIEQSVIKEQERRCPFLRPG